MPKLPTGSKEEALLRKNPETTLTSVHKPISRRRFISSAALATVGAALPFREAAATTRSGNTLPGRIVIWEDLQASSGSAVDLTVVKQMVEGSLVALTGQANPVSALESLMPGLDTTKRVTFKVNCINPTVATRWEVVRAVTDLLRQTCGGAYPPGNITIYDKPYPNPNMTNSGYTAANFPGVSIVPNQSPDPNTLIEVAPGVTVQLSSHIVNCDYLINAPVLKNHGQSDKRWTLAFKNHIGSVSPVQCHTPNPRLLNISASQHVREKTRLILLSGVHGVWLNGPGGGIGNWSNTFPEEGTPNLVMLSTDPVTLEHWGIDLINKERAAWGQTVYYLPYCEDAAGLPWNLGLFDFSQHEVVTNLAAPSNLSVRLTGTGAVYLQWAVVPGASKYRIYRSTDPYFRPDPWTGANLLAETTFLSYTDPAGAGDPSTNCYYVVRAYRACWESGDSVRVGAFDYAC
jgi:uncharacterized protein (DUF362 family)